MSYAIFTNGTRHCCYYIYIQTTLTENKVVRSPPYKTSDYRTLKMTEAIPSSLAYGVQAYKPLRDCLCRALTNPESGG